MPCTGCGTFADAVDCRGMGSSDRKRGSKSGKKVRVAFRRNRSKPARVKDWTKRARSAEENEVDAATSEHVVAKGDLSRHRTVTVHDDEGDHAGTHCGVVVALRGLYADVDDGERLWPCTVTRVLRSRLTEERHPVTTGDRVRFQPVQTAPETQEEGVIVDVLPRRGQLRRRAGRRTQTIVANVDQVIIVSSAAEPYPKPQLIDRYIVSAVVGGVTPVVCMNKIDLDEDGRAAAVLQRYADLSYTAFCTSATSGVGIETLIDTLKDQESVIVGQSGVGKSSLLNAAQPGLKLRTGDVSAQKQKGRHTTTTASLIRLAVGGYVVDTPGIRSFDLSMLEPNEFEACFVEFVEHVPNCKFPDCTHTHEVGCAVKAAVESGHIHTDRYESYVRLLEDLSDPV